MRWFLIDRYTDIKPRVSLMAHKLISHNESFFETHFPWEPIFPPTLLLEMMAQAGGVLAGISLGFSKDVILGKIEKAEFFRKISPPRGIRIEARLTAEDTGSAWAEMVLSDETGAVAMAKIMFVFLPAASGPGGGSAVFTDDFLKTYKLLEYKKNE